MTPDGLAGELGISARTLRAWLRQEFPRPGAEKNTPWVLTPAHVAAARARWPSPRETRPSTSTDARPRRRDPQPAGAAASLPQVAVRWDTRFERSFRRHGFGGFTQLGAAVADRRAFVREHATTLATPGVYAVFAPADWTSAFRTRGAIENVITPWPLARLRERWIDDVELIYIGCAGATASSRTLRKRIGDLLKHGAGQLTTSGPHKGGERLWQCRGWEQFTLAWHSTGRFPEPHAVEVAIGERFRAQTGQLPFANVRL